MGKTEFAKRIVETLAHAQLSQTELAQKLSERLHPRQVKPQVVQYLCDRAKSSEFTADIAIVCGVNYEWLRSGTGPKQAAPRKIYEIEEPLRLSTPAQKLIEQIKTADARGALNSNAASGLSAIIGQISGGHARVVPASELDVLKRAVSEVQSLVKREGHSDMPPDAMADLVAMVYQALSNNTPMPHAVILKMVKRA